MRTWLMLAAVIVAATLGAAIPAAAATQGPAHSTHTVRVLTTPTVDFLMSGRSGNFYRTITTSTIRNPSNYNIRAVIRCNDNSVHYGSWGNGLGGSVASCSGDTGNTGYFQFDKTHKYEIGCWGVGFPASGQCTGNKAVHGQ
jgi:hypothetical protein